MASNSNQKIEPEHERDGPERTGYEAFRAWLRQSFAEKIGAGRPSRRYLDSFGDYVSLATFVVVLAYTVISFFLWVAQQSANAINARNLVDANRGWISPIYATANISAGIGNPIFFNITYENIGKSPALDLNWKFDTGYFPTPRNDDGRQITVRKNDTCTNLLPQSAGPAEFPAWPIPVHGAEPHTISGRSDDGLHNTKIDGDMITDKRRFYIQGCVAYKTMGVVGRTGFCYYFIPVYDGKNKILSNLNLGMCPGNPAE